MRKSTSGFTIVELLIVIVVIAILATISIIAYTGIRVRARDTLRSDSVAKIERALELYRVDYGQYPSATANPGNGGWEVSDDVSGSFMEYLKPYGFPSTTPVDPVNTPSYRFWYYRYAPGTYTCPVENGGFYVLRAWYESAANKPSTGTGVTCPTGSQNGSGTLYLNSKFEN